MALTGQTGLQPLTYGGQQPTYAGPATGVVDFTDSALDPSRVARAADPVQIGSAIGAPAQDAMGVHADKRAGQAAAGAETSAVNDLSGFLLSVSGEVESADVSGSGEPLMCVLAFTHGADWALLQGSPGGVTQLGCAAAPTLDVASRVQRNTAEVIFNFPFGLVFKSTNPYGWPRLTLSVYGTDWCNRRVIRGYGSVHVPTTPGRHTRVVRLYTPLASSWRVRFFGWLHGEPAHYLDPRVVASPDGRDVTRVLSGGYVKVVFNVVLKDTAAFNLNFAKPKTE